jgi:prepilin-type N-terminal cleavage/methylation domain-containing protein
MIARPHAARLAAPRSGFTLLEVLVVVTILVILASLATFASVSYLRSAKLSQADLQMQKIEQAIKTYYIQSGGAYPPSLEALITRTEAGPPLLEGGASAIVDPFNQQPYQFTVTQDQNGGERVVVSFVTPDGQQRTWPRN